MKNSIIIALSGLMLSTTNIKAQTTIKTNIKVNVNHVHTHNGFTGRHVSNTWVAYIEDEKVYIEFTGEDWNTERMFLLSDLGALPNGNEGTFAVTREAGTVTFTGEFEGGKGRGFYKFTEKPAFRSYLTQKGYNDIDKQLMLRIFLTDINKSYFAYMKANGYTAISNAQLRDLAEQDLSRPVIDDYFNFFKTENYGHQSLDKIVELREHGVNAKFVNSFYQMGYKNIPLEKALELRDHGVNPEFINSFRKMGYGELSLDQAQDLRDHGVSPDFINSIQEMGYKNITLDRAQELKDHGVNPSFIKSIQALGFKELSLDKAQELVDHGVTVSYIQKVKNKGLNVHTLDDYIRLRDTGFSE